MIKGEIPVGRIYRWPLILALVTIAALVTGLLAEGVLDIAAVVALAAVACWCLWKFVRAQFD